MLASQEYSTIKDVLHFLCFHLKELDKPRKALTLFGDATATTYSEHGFEHASQGGFHASLLTHFFKG